MEHSNVKGEVGSVKTVVGSVTLYGTSASQSLPTTNHLAVKAETQPGDVPFPDFALPHVHNLRLTQNPRRFHCVIRRDTAVGSIN